MTELASLERETEEYIYSGVGGAGRSSRAGLVAALLLSTTTHRRPDAGRRTIEDLGGYAGPAPNSS